MSMTQQTVPPQAGQGQQSKGRGVFAFVVLLLAVIVAVSGITNLINGNLGGTLVCIVVTVLLVKPRSFCNFLQGGFAFYRSMKITPSSARSS
jgi:hypothetical protein